MQRAPFNRSILRITLATTVAVLMGTTLVACNRNSTDAETTAAPAGEQQRDDRAGEVQPSAQQPLGQGQQQMGQPGMGQGQQGQQGQQGMGQGQAAAGSGAQDIMAARGNEACPMMVEGASVDVENTADGVALRFTSTTAGNVEDLRNRVEHMARMYEMHGGGKDKGGSMMWHRMGHMRADQDQPGAGGQGQGPAGAMPAATARVEDVDNGARLVLTPKDKTQLTALREHARDHERRMESGECWMMQDQMGDQGQMGGDQDKPGHRPGESAPGDGRPKT
jgi:hypothetical protein